jgi:hypothetical protein
MLSEFLIGETRFVICNDLANFDCNIQKVIKKRLDEKTHKYDASYWEVTKDNRLVKSGSIHTVFEYIEKNSMNGNLKLYRNTQVVAKSTV